MHKFKVAQICPRFSDGALPSITSPSNSFTQEAETCLCSIMGHYFLPVFYFGNTQIILKLIFFGQFYICNYMLWFWNQRKLSLEITLPFLYKYLNACLNSFFKPLWVYLTELSSISNVITAKCHYHFGFVQQSPHEDN